MTAVENPWESVPRAVWLDGYPLYRAAILRDWCNENGLIIRGWAMTQEGVSIRFFTDEEAMMFALRWKGVTR